MLESLNCNSCGAPLEVPSSAMYVKCAHCNANLKVRRTGGGTFTEVVEQLTATTEDLAEQVAKLTAHNDLAELDRQWQVERQSFMVTSKKGHRRLPTQGVALAGGIGAAVFGGLWTIMAIAITQSAPNYGPFAVAKFVFPAFGFAFIGFGILSAVAIHSKAEDYRRSERRYRRRRSELLNKDKH